MARTKIQRAPDAPVIIPKDASRKANKTVTIGISSKPRRARPEVSGKTPAHKYIHTGGDGGHLGGKSYYPRPPKRTRRNRVIYTAPPLKTFVKPIKRGAKALHEISHFQSTTSFLIPRAPLDRLVKEIAQSYGDYRFTRGAIETLRVATEAKIVSLFQKAQLLALHAKRVTIRDTDLALVLKLSEMGQENVTGT